MTKGMMNKNFVFAVIFSLLGSIGVTAAKAQTVAVPRMFFFDTNSVLKARVKDPSVVRFRGQYWMYYSAWITPSNITSGVATSANLVDWKHVAFLPLEGFWEADGIAAPGAMVWNDKIHLFYQSYGGTNISAILHAWSADGTNFVRDQSNPIFRPTGDWNNSRAIDAEVMRVGTNLFLYSATRDSLGQTQQITLASAPLTSDWSRSNWTQLSVSGPTIAPQVPTALDAASGITASNLKWEGQCIEASTMVKRGGYLYMFYAGGYNNFPQQIGVAVSKDGINFARMFKGQPLLPRGAAGTWNHSESGHPGVYQDDYGRDFLFYQGDNTKIGLEWRLSMIPLQWQSGGPGNPDVPVLAPERLSPAALREAFQAEDFSERWMRNGGWPCEVIADGAAADGYALECVFGTSGVVPTAKSPETRYLVNFSEAGDYDLYARVAVNKASQSFFVGTHLNSTTNYGLVGNLAAVAPSTNYFWINVSRGVAVDGQKSYTDVALAGGARPTPLGRFAVAAAGTNLFSIRGGDAGVKLDAFVFEKSNQLTSQALNAIVAKSTPAFEPRQVEMAGRGPHTATFKRKLGPLTVGAVPKLSTNRVEWFERPEIISLKISDASSTTETWTVTIRPNDIGADRLFLRWE